MKLAPIQMKQLSFRRVNVELDVQRFSAGEFKKLKVPFDFEHVEIATHVGFAPMQGDSSSNDDFLVTLQVVIKNPTPAGERVSRPSPYLIDIEAGAVIRVVPSAGVQDDIQDLAIVNGTSLLWSAIREQVCNLTARMPAGLATLPTVNFRDLRKDQRKDNDKPKLNPRSRSERKAAKSGESAK